MAQKSFLVPSIVYRNVNFRLSAENVTNGKESRNDPQAADGELQLTTLLREPIADQSL